MCLSTSYYVLTHQGSRVLLLYCGLRPLPGSVSSGVPRDSGCSDRSATIRSVLASSVFIQTYSWSRLSAVIVAFVLTKWLSSWLAPLGPCSGAIYTPGFACPSVVLRVASAAISCDFIIYSRKIAQRKIVSSFFNAIFSLKFS